MAKYLTIGKMAERANTSVKALRYYEKIGILKPDFTDEENGYRYYRPARLQEIRIIQACLAMDIPLKELLHYQSPDGSIDFKALLDYGYQLAMYKRMAIEKTIAFIESAKKDFTKKEGE